MKDIGDVFWSQLFRDLTKIEFNEISRCAEALERALAEEGKRFEQEIERQTAKMSEERKIDYYDMAGDEFHQFYETFPRILRYSLFVHTYSLFERDLLRFAEHVRGNQKLDLSLSDLRDEGIIRAQTYLKKVAKFPFPDIGEDWNAIKMLNQVRNLIVHKTGYFPEDHPKKAALEQFMQSWNNEISLDRDREFVLAATFIGKVIDICKGFLLSLHSTT